MSESSEPVATPITDEITLGTDHIIGMSFDKATRADEVLLNISHLAREGEITITDAVVVDGLGAVLAA